MYSTKRIILSFWRMRNSFQILWNLPKYNPVVVCGDDCLYDYFILWYNGVSSMIISFILGFFIPIMIGIPATIGFFFAEELSNIFDRDIRPIDGTCIGWIIGTALAAPIFMILCIHFMLPILSIFFLTFAFMSGFISIPVYLLEETNNKANIALLIGSTIISLILAELFRQMSILTFH